MGIALSMLSLRYSHFSIFAEIENHKNEKNSMKRTINMFSKSIRLTNLMRIDKTSKLHTFMKITPFSQN